MLVFVSMAIGALAMIISIITMLKVISVFGGWIIVFTIIGIFAVVGLLWNALRNRP